ncbi:hypothetical protein [Reyranella sp.]|uniref:hypothetical protein n=1 Tax=Reyranella sp. TaxID=1929291 RepID=UPI003D115356
MKDRPSRSGKPLLKPGQGFDEPMPAEGPSYDQKPAVPSAPADTFCLALYALANGRMKRRIDVATVARRLGVSYEQADAMLTEADAAGLVHHKARTVALTHKGQAFADTLERASR